jgi:kynurenine formamidase
MWDEEYWHLENLMNLDQIGRRTASQLSVLPVKWVGTTAAPVRAVAIVDE